MIKLTRKIESYGQVVTRTEVKELELHGLDDLTASAFSAASVQVTHGPGGPVPPPFAARVYLREPARFNYARIFEYIEEKPPMPFVVWCLSMQLLTPAHVFRGLSAHSANVDRADLLELLGCMIDYFEHEKPPAQKSAQ